MCFYLNAHLYETAKVNEGGEVPARLDLMLNEESRADGVNVSVTDVLSDIHVKEGNRVCGMSPILESILWDKNRKQE